MITNSILKSCAISFVSFTTQRAMPLVLLSMHTQIIIICKHNQYVYSGNSIRDKAEVCVVIHKQHYSALTCVKKATYMVQRYYFIQLYTTFESLHYNVCYYYLDYLVRH